MAPATISQFRHLIRTLNSYSPVQAPLLLAREVFRGLAGDGNVTNREVYAC